MFLQEQPNRRTRSLQRAGDSTASAHGVDKAASYAGFHSLEAARVHYSVAPTARDAVQMARLQNPHPVAGLPPIAEWDQTAHHVVPRCLLYDAYTLLKNNEIGQVADAVPPAPDGMTPEHMMEWPPGNLFYGPNTSLREEPSGSKEDFDSDAQFFMEPSQYERLKNCYHRILNAVAAVNAHNTPETRGSLKDALVTLYRSTYEPGSSPAITREDQWKEISDSHELEQAEGLRPSIRDHAYFKIPAAREPARSPEGYPEITLDGGNYQYRGKVIKGLKAKGPLLFIPIKTDPGLYEYLLGKDAPISSYLPAKYWELNRDFLPSVARAKADLPAMVQKEKQICASLAAAAQNLKKRDARIDLIQELNQSYGLNPIIARGQRSLLSPLEDLFAGVLNDAGDTKEQRQEKTENLMRRVRELSRQTALISARYSQLLDCFAGAKNLMLRSVPRDAPPDTKAAFQTRAKKIEEDLSYLVPYCDELKKLRDA